MALMLPWLNGPPKPEAVLNCSPKGQGLPGYAWRPRLGASTRIICTDNSRTVLESSSVCLQTNIKVKKNIVRGPYLLASMGVRLKACLSVTCIVRLFVTWLGFAPGLCPMLSPRLLVD
eukprot:scaffold10021_cov20-Tisochrysis_lutea.AAC.4